MLKNTDSQSSFIKISHPISESHQSLPIDSLLRLGGYIYEDILNLEIKIAS